MVEPILGRHILVTGGSRSGKSKFAEEQAVNLGDPVVYLATAQALDPEMEERIALHRKRRPADWLTVEAPLDVDLILPRYNDGYTVLLDCLTMYVSNLYFELEANAAAEVLETKLRQKVEVLALAVRTSRANLIIVTNEIGWGVVPDNALARRFRDLAGWANQVLASACNEAYLIVSGIPVRIKGGVNV